MAYEGDSRFDRLVSLTPRRFHISENPPFAVGLVLCGHTNQDDDSGSQFSLQRPGIPNCKPGIWTSIIMDVPGEGFMECILRWVAPGSIDLGQSVEKWEDYEKETRKVDEASWEGWKVKNGWKRESKEGVEWRREGHYFDDGGICCVISTDYLTRGAYENLMGDEEGGYDYYVETLTLSAMDGEPQNSGFCIGGMSFGQDAVGCPPRVSVAEESGQIVAVRIHGGEDKDEEDEE